MAYGNMKSGTGMGSMPKGNGSKMKGKKGKPMGKTMPPHHLPEHNPAMNQSQPQKFGEMLKKLHGG